MVTTQYSINIHLWSIMYVRVGGSTVRSRGTRSVADECEPSDGFMPDNGSGDKEIYRVENFELAPVSPNTYGKFFGGDSYVIKYKYHTNGQEKYILYFWQVSFKVKINFCTNLISKYKPCTLVGEVVATSVVAHKDSRMESSHPNQ